MSPKRNKPLSRFRALSVVCVCFCVAFIPPSFFSLVRVCLLPYRCITKAYNVNFFVYTAWCLFVLFFLVSRQIIDTQEKHNRLFFLSDKHAVPWFSLLLSSSSSFFYIPSSVIKIKNLNYMKILFLYQREPIILQN